MKQFVLIALTMAVATGVKLEHHHHHHHHKAKETYPSVDSHSKIVPYVVRDHSWNNTDFDRSNRATWYEETETIAPKKSQGGWAKPATDIRIPPEDYESTKSSTPAAAPAAAFF